VQRLPFRFADAEAAQHALFLGADVSPGLITLPPICEANIASASPRWLSITLLTPVEPAPSRLLPQPGPSHPPG